MPNVYFRAKHLWEHGDREGGFALINHAISDHIGNEPFARPDTLLSGSFVSRYELLVGNLLSETFVNSARTFLQAPFGRVWAALWMLDRFDYWVHILLRYDFFRRPEAIGFDDEKFTPPMNEERDYDSIIDVLAESARKGELSPHGHDQPNGGRPVLTLEMLDAVNDVRWGALKPRLRTRLAEAYEMTPADPWRCRMGEDPEGIAIDFLHDLFGRYGSPSSAAEARWKAIRRDHPAYAHAAQEALGRLLDHASPVYANEVVKYDAGRDVADGAVWLQALTKALETEVFSALA